MPFTCLRGIRFTSIVRCRTDGGTASAIHAQIGGKIGFGTPGIAIEILVDEVGLQEGQFLLLHLVHPLTACNLSGSGQLLPHFLRGIQLRIHHIVVWHHQTVAAVQEEKLTQVLRRR